MTTQVTTSGAYPEPARATPGRCALWGILNVTPDSFSDGGLYLSQEAALARARRLLEEGADVIDVGGASSRPRGVAYGDGAQEVPTEVEQGRVLPVIRSLAPQGVTLSIDTTRAEVAEAALEAGATIVNDVSCARSDRLLRVTAEAGAEYVLMHTRGDGAVTPAHTDYGDLLPAVLRELSVGIERAMAAGIERARIWIDPGLGFAKTPAQSIQLLSCTAALRSLGLPVLVGPSRKHFIGATAKLPDGRVAPPAERKAGTDAAVALAAFMGADAVRVHDVAESRMALQIALAVRDAGGPP